MLTFLSKHKMTTRVYSCFVILGFFAVLLAFAGMGAVGFVHNEYTKSNSVVESVRRLSSLEASLFSLNRSLFFFSIKSGNAERAAAQEAFSDFENKVAEMEPFLTTQETQEKFNQTVLSSVDRYRTEMEQLFSIQDKKLESEGELRKSARDSSEKLATMIEEATLPSATFALNNLQEQLQAVLMVMDSSLPAEEYTKQITVQLADLKKAATAAKQAEMVNAKQLKAVLTALGTLDDEAKKKLKFDRQFNDTVKQINAIGEENAKNLKDLVDSMILSSAKILTQAETAKISMQKMFVFCAAAAGILTLLLSIISLFGTKYPLTRLIEAVQEMARGNYSIHIHFSERRDEVGDLARSLSALLNNLKSPATSLDDENLFGKTAATYGTSLAYVPLGSPANTIEFSEGETPSHALSQEKVPIDKNDADITYFGENTGVDQALELIKHIRSSALTSSAESKERFALYHKHLSGMVDVVGKLSDTLEDIYEKTKAPLFAGLSNLTKEIVNTGQDLLVSSDDITLNVKEDEKSVQKIAYIMDKAQDFIGGVFDWTRLMLDLSSSVQESSTQTKILALNASIEAAKAGEKHKNFSSLAAEIRNQTQHTVQTAEQFQEHLTEIQSQTYAFATMMDGINKEIQFIKANTERVLTLSEGQRTQAGKMDAFSEAFATELETASNAYSGMELAVSQSVQLTQALKAGLPSLQTEVDTIQKKLKDFVAELPVYEEEKTR